MEGGSAPCRLRLGRTRPNQLDAGGGIVPEFQGSLEALWWTGSNGGTLLATILHRGKPVDGRPRTQHRPAHQGRCAPGKRGPRSTKRQARTMATSGLRRDHSILVRVVEARQLPVDCQDAYCVLRIDNNVADQVRPPARTGTRTQSTCSLTLRVVAGPLASGVHRAVPRSARVPSGAAASRCGTKSTSSSSTKSSKIFPVRARFARAPARVGRPRVDPPGT